MKHDPTKTPTNQLKTASYELLHFQIALLQFASSHIKKKRKTPRLFAEKRHQKKDGPNGPSQADAGLAAHGIWTKAIMERMKGLTA